MTSDQYLQQSVELLDALGLIEPLRALIGVSIAFAFLRYALGRGG